MTSDPYRGVLVDVYAPNVTIKYNLIIDPECDAPFDPARNYVYLLGAGQQPGIVSEGNLVFKTWEEAGLIDKDRLRAIGDQPGPQCRQGPHRFHHQGP
jgi:hypothetical protein